MPELVKILFNICLLRKGPEDLPCDMPLMMFLVGVSLAVSVWLGTIIYDPSIAGLSSITGLFFSFVFAKFLLLKNPERFIQTFCAMMGTVTLINLISVPVVYPLSNEELNENLVLFFGLLSFALFVWIIVVYGFIFSRAIASTLANGVAISVGYALLSIMILQLFLSGRAAS